MATNPKVAGLQDINARELAALLPMVILIFWIGIFPNAFLNFMHPSVLHLLERVNSGGTPAVAANIVSQILR
jgi:NADH-quinone oxidoreductase subunit M